MAKAMTGRSTFGISKDLNLDRNLVARVMNSEDFRIELAEIQADLMQDVRNAMTQLAINSLSYMAKLLEDADADDALKLRAAEFIVAKTADVARAEELSRRLNALEDGRVLG